MAEPKSNKKQIIKCPHCGWEYTPADIFMPGELIGKPESVVRDALGKIIYHEYEEGEEPEQTESFICEECGKPFVVEPTVTYKVKKEEEALDFTEQYVSLLD